MKLAVTHSWDLPANEARALQSDLAGQVILRPTFDLGAVSRVAGVDVDFRGDIARAAVVVLSFPSLEPLATSVAEAPVTFPYRSGLLAFREGPAVLAAIDGLDVWPDVWLFDAQGLAHPRRLGLASHMGVLLDQPSIGCAKSRLTGSHTEPGRNAGDWVDLVSGDTVIGSVVRTRLNGRPLYISIGHRIDLPTARDLVLACCRGYRLPEPTRLAHNVAGGVLLSVSPRQP